MSQTLVIPWVIAVWREVPLDCLAFPEIFLKSRSAVGIRMPHRRPPFTEIQEFLPSST